MHISAFTTKCSNLVNSLKNRIKIEYSGSEIEVDALWDTGATNSCISNEVVEKLQLIPTGKIYIKTPTGIGERNTYLVDIYLPNNVRIKDLKVIDSEIGSQNIGMLVGMDIIGSGDFAVSNFNGKTVFTFAIPSAKHIDFVQDMRISKIVGKKHGKGKNKK